MKHSFLYDIDALIIVFALFVLMFSAIKIGFRIGVKQPKPEADDSGILAALLGLLALLLAFTFGMAGTRYETRKANMVTEANEIGTAILRADLYHDSLTMAFKKDFENYLDGRIAFFMAGRDDAKVAQSQRKVAVASAFLWKRATTISKGPNSFIQSNMMLPSLNGMFDSAEAANASFRSSVPDSIVFLLLMFSVVISFYIGYNSGLKKEPHKFFMFGFCLLTCIVVFITLDLDRPRRGTIDMKEEIILLEDIKSTL